MEDKNKDIIDLGLIFKTLWAKKKRFFIVWPIVFVLSVLWIIPQPRYYDCSVSLAPETANESVAGGLAGIASNFGIDIGTGGGDAIYPLLYPELMSSNDFVVGLLSIRVKTKDGSIDTDYYTYLTKHQKKNWLTQPINKAMDNFKSIFVEKKPKGVGKPSALNPFMLNENDNGLVEKVKKAITCTVDKKTSVITIGVKDQDPLVCATLADSVKLRLQEFIIDYRTSKARLDVIHYQELVDSSKVAYDKAVSAYSAYCDANQDILLQSELSERDKLEGDMQLKYNTYTTMQTQLEMTKARLQERTPAFTTLQSASVPNKPSGPKRMLFVAGMLIMSTIVYSLWLVRKDILTPQQM